MKILVAGDYCPINRITEYINQSSYNEILGDIKDVISSVDYSIVNFECPITNGSELPIKKSGPNLHCRPNGLDALQWVGFDCVTLANNHFRDYGEDGVTQTIELCHQKGIDVVGGGKQIQDAKKTLIKEIEGKKIAIINCCENEFSIASEHHGGSNPLNPIKQYYDIKDAKTKADFVIVIVHGGHEHFQYPSLRMVETYRFFVDSGADVVINHHQHCYSGFEVYHEKPIFYGLGNFCFDNNSTQKTKWNYGYMVVLNLEKEITYDLIPYEQCTDTPTVKLLDRDAFDETISTINKAILDLRILQEIQNNYYSESQYNLKVGLFPLSNRIIRSILQRRLLHSILPQKWLLRLENYSMCESHRDKLKYFFDNSK